MRRAIFLLTIASALLTISCSRGPVTEATARRIAEESFARTCRSFHLDPSEYRGPVSTSVGGAAFAYEWSHGAKVDHGVLISIREDGWDDVAFLRGGP
jgi:hypothetical protein